MYINNKARSKDMSRSVIKYYVQDAYGQTLGEFSNRAEASDVGMIFPQHNREPYLTQS
jgi:hypothetical protein